MDLYTVIANNPDLIKDGVKFAMAWWLIRGEVKKHFVSMTASIDNLTAAFKNLETKHDLRITNLEHEVKELKETQHAG